MVYNASISQITAVETHFVKAAFASEKRFAVSCTPITKTSVCCIFKEAGDFARQEWYVHQQVSFLYRIICILMPFSLIAVWKLLTSILHFLYKCLSKTKRPVTWPITLSVSARYNTSRRPTRPLLRHRLARSYHKQLRIFLKKREIG